MFSEGLQKGKEMSHNNVLSRNVGTIDFSTRVAGRLYCLGIETIADLVQYSAGDVLCWRNIGKKSLMEIEYTLSKMGVHLRTPDHRHGQVLLRAV